MKTITLSQNTPHEYRTGKSWSMDEKGYCIIKIFYEKQLLGVRHYTATGEANLEIFGDDSYEIVQWLVVNKYITKLQHAAYLGHELNKAQTAMKNRLYYNQDERLDFDKKTTCDPSENKN